MENNKKNMEQNNTNNNNERKEGTNMEKKITLTEIKTAMSAANMARENTESILAASYLDTMEDMDTTFAKYNQALIAAAYEEMKTPADVMKRGHYSPLHPQWDKKNNTFKAVPRVTRLNVLDFIKEKKIESALPEKIKALTEKLTAFIRSEIQYDGHGKKTVNVKEVLPALQAVMDEIGIENMIARNRDARFLAYACTGGSGSIGSLREINPARVATMLVDVYTVQLSGGAYDFEKKDNENAAK